MGSKFKRVEQWLVFARMWYLYDAKWQNPFDSAEKIAHVLCGRHKTIFSLPENYAGDHVVVMNTKDIAMPNEEWKYRYYYHHTMYAKGASFTPVWEVHNKDPTKVLYKAVYRQCGGGIKDRKQRNGLMARLHLFPDENIPKEILENLADQMSQIRAMPKRVDEFSEQEVDKFPKLFDWPEKYVIK